ncbi:MAG: hypothetical protein RIF41_39310, partial [Polyangiaceae bacterium]
MHLRTITWNVNGRRDVAHQLAMMDHLGWDVALLQEVRPAGFPTFRDHHGVTGADHALRHRPDRDEPWACALLVREPFELVSCAPIANLPSPERSLCALIRHGNLTFEVASLALPPASSGWKQLKAVQADIFADRWASRTHPLVAGLDRNSPFIDHPDLNQTVWFWEAEERLFGPSPKHDLRDVLRTHLHPNPSKRRRLLRERPEGPLATSFMRGTGRGDTPARYDAIYASPEWRVLDVTYPWQASLEAGSDHGAVWAHLELDPNASPRPAGKDGF